MDNIGDIIRQLILNDRDRLRDEYVTRYMRSCQVTREEAEASFDRVAGAVLGVPA